MEGVGESSIGDWREVGRRNLNNSTIFKISSSLPHRCTLVCFSRVVRRSPVGRRHVRATPKMYFF